MNRTSLIMLKLARTYITMNLNKTITRIMKTSTNSVIEIKYTIIDIINSGTFGLITKIRINNNTNFHIMKMVYENPKYYQREIEYLCQLNHTNVIKIFAYYYECLNHTNINEIKEGADFIFYCIILPYYQFDMTSICIRNQLKFKLIHKPELKHKPKLKPEPEPEPEPDTELKPDLRSTRVLHLLKQALEGIDHMHSFKICHRDIKPANILLDNNDNLVICDLGSAKKLEKNITNVSYICSRRYRAPENCIGNVYYDIAIDVWAIGVVFVEIVCMIDLFNGESNSDQLDVILDLLKYDEDDRNEMGIVRVSSGPGIRALLEKYEVDECIVNILEKCVVLNPRKRKTAKELLEIINSY